MSQQDRGLSFVAGFSNFSQGSVGLEKKVFVFPFYLACWSFKDFVVYFGV